MIIFTSGNLSHAYVKGNHRKYSTVFGKLWKCLKTVSYAFLGFRKFSKIFLSNFTSFENFLKINIRETGPNTRVHGP